MLVHGTQVSDLSTPIEQNTKAYVQLYVHNFSDFLIKLCRRLNNKKSKLLGYAWPPVLPGLLGVCAGIAQLQQDRYFLLHG